MVAEDGVLLKLRKSPPLLDFARMVWRRFDEDRCLQIASSLTFTTLLAIVPIFLLWIYLSWLVVLFGTVSAAPEAAVAPIRIQAGSAGARSQPRSATRMSALRAA